MGRKISRYRQRRAEDAGDLTEYERKFERFDRVAPDEPDWSQSKEPRDLLRRRRGDPTWR